MCACRALHCDRRAGGGRGLRHAIPPRTCGVGLRLPRLLRILLFHLLVLLLATLLIQLLHALVLLAVHAHALRVVVRYILLAAAAGELRGGLDHTLLLVVLVANQQQPAAGAVPRAGLGAGGAAPAAGTP